LNINPREDVMLGDKGKEGHLKNTLIFKETFHKITLACAHEGE
jgi:hypothetical protein